MISLYIDTAGPNDDIYVHRLKVESTVLQSEIYTEDIKSTGFV